MPQRLAAHRSGRPAGPCTARRRASRRSVPLVWPSTAGRPSEMLRWPLRPPAEESETLGRALNIQDSRLWRGSLGTNGIAPPQLCQPRTGTGPRATRLPWDAGDNTLKSYAAGRFPASPEPGHARKIARPFGRPLLRRTKKARWTGLHRANYGNVLGRTSKNNSQRLMTRLLQEPGAKRRAARTGGRACRSNP